MNNLPMALRSRATLARTSRCISRLSSSTTISSTPSQSCRLLLATQPFLSLPQTRYSSHSPLSAEPATATPARKETTLRNIKAMHERSEPITVITAHDFPSALVADAAGIEIILVGDSLAMVALGMEDTSEVLVEEMLLHCRSVARATKSFHNSTCSADPFIIGDLPMGSYEVSPEQALETAIRFVKYGRMKGVKLEGGRDMAPAIKRITAAGIPVLAHVGLTPQRHNALGGFKVQGRTAVSAAKVLDDALAVQEAGAFATVMEAVPTEIAALITPKLSIPTIGIGAGKGCSGQVLVQIDMLGNHPPGRLLPRFVKKYGDVWAESLKAIETYRAEVKSRAYPAPEHAYHSAKEETRLFRKTLSSIPDPERSRHYVA